MPSQLLENTRKLSKIIQNAGPDGLIFSDLTNVLGELLKCNVFIVSKKGKVLGYTLVKNSSSIPYSISENDEIRVPDDFNVKLLLIDETETDMSSSGFFAADSSKVKTNINIMPIKYGGDRLGTLLVESTASLTNPDIILAEYGATIVSIEIMRSEATEMEDEARKKADVQMALSTLSYSELEAVEHIFEELDGREGLLVASKIADRVGITRSVIVNALRKFESAGIIESRSLGMKGTHIKILNDKLLPELKKLK